MTLNQFLALKRGDKIRFEGKDEIWEVDHPASVSKKKETFNVDTDVAVPCIAGGGECIADGRCIRASMIVLNGRGAPRHTQTFSDPAPWTKVI